MASAGDARDRVTAGLCADCRHARRVASARGSLFSLCEVGLRDPRFPRYPILPVRRCAAYQPASDPGGPGDGASREE